ncbi:kinesin-domain-containing protein [Clavulina sp. PMI_390]|nr:kinesin-domain-containing protein [Clavulina sp. PMI_390]
MRPPSATNLSSAEIISTRPSRPTTSDIPTRETRTVSSSSSVTAVSVTDRTVSATRPRSPSRSTKEQNNNIRVVVRCRGLSRSEIAQKSRIAVTTDGPRAEEITIPALNRNYEFDQVLGADADQSVIYQDVVVPMLDQVFEGYNATLCAYGQTGAGKTYTMHGELDVKESGGLSSHAGVVPRVITRIFRRLEKDYNDFSVCISYMELYNEELRDLLASPTSNVPLKLFEESPKKTLIQGLLEIRVKDVGSALSLLRSGNKQRQTAMTNLNERSSRSHSIFSISVTTAAGSKESKDMFQIGKLNLVDLAGSEDIGRSGAENLRAKEAGNINKSLLSLGRVINALVENPTGHIPYRESVLTRVLQDSLGGHTKTCIIATVSPAQSNLEETISTLDYATKARSIKNRPDAGRRVAKHTLLKEMVAEMDRLRADLNATREKNGRYFDEARWAEIEAEQGQLARERAEARKAREVTAAQLATLQEDFEDHTELLKRQTSELLKAKEELARTTLSLEQRTHDLALTTRGLEEEIAARKIFEQSEAHLDTVASGLSSAARQGISDLDALFRKIDRKEKVLGGNITHIRQLERDLSASTEAVATLIAQHRQQQSSLLEETTNQARGFLQSQSEILTQSAAEVVNQFASLSDAVTGLLKKEDASATLSSALHHIISDTSNTLRTNLAAWQQDVVQNQSILLGELRTSWDEQTSEVTIQVSKSIHGISGILEILNRDLKDHVEQERKSFASLNLQTETMLTAEITRLQNHNDDLEKLLRSEKASADSLRSEVIQQVTKIMTKHTDSRDASLREVAARFSAQTTEGLQGLETFRKHHGASVNAIVSDQKELVARVDVKGKETRRVRDAASRALTKLTASLEDGIEQFAIQSKSEVVSLSAMLGQDLDGLDEATAGSFQRLETGRQARMEELNSMHSRTRRAHELLETQLETAASSLSSRMTGIIEAGTAARDGLATFGQATGGEISSLGEMSRLLTRRGARDDIPTGTTPHKRKWEFEDDWEVVRDRAGALRRFHEQQQQRESFGAADVQLQSPIVVPPPLHHEELGDEPLIGDSQGPEGVVMVDEPMGPPEPTTAPSTLPSTSTSTTAPPPVQALGSALTASAPVRAASSSMNGHVRPRGLSTTGRPSQAAGSKNSGTARVAKRPASVAGGAVHGRGAGALVERQNATTKRRDRI